MSDKPTGPGVLLWSIIFMGGGWLLSIAGENATTKPVYFVGHAGPVLLFVGFCMFFPGLINTLGNRHDDKAMEAYRKERDRRGFAPYIGFPTWEEPRFDPRASNDQVLRHLWRMAPRHIGGEGGQTFQRRYWHGRDECTVVFEYRDGELEGIGYYGLASAYGIPAEYWQTPQIPPGWEHTKVASREQTVHY